MFRTILFDFDGTVFDTVEGITKSVRYALNKRGIDAELEALRCFAGPPLDEMFAEKFGFDHDEAIAAVADFRERYLPVGLYECRIFPGIRELTEHLRGAGFKLGIATSKPEELAVKLLARENMVSRFDVICGTKPGMINTQKWQVVAEAMEALGADKGSTVLIGDTKYDVIGAHRCGIPCIGVSYGYAAEGELEQAGADGIVNTLDELESLLRE